MTDDDMIRTYMTAAGMIMEDLSARLILEPLSDGLTGELRLTARDLVSTADIVDRIRRISPSAD